MYAISQDDITGLAPSFHNPQPLVDCRSDCHAFFRRANAVITTILNCLDAKTALHPGTLAALSSLDNPSDTSLRLLRINPLSADTPITLGGHTDIGIIPMLFNIVDGLQVLPAASGNVPDNWRYIRPETDYALINLDDTLVEWTGSILRSASHHVVRAPGTQRNVTRQSIAYLVRPARDQTMERLKSPFIPRVK